MTDYNIIAIIVIALASIGIIAIKIFSMKKNNKEVTINSFIKEYSSNIIKILQDFIKIMQVDIKNFDSKEKYNEALVKLCVESIKDDSSIFGIDKSIINIFNTDAITECVCKILNAHKTECFSVLDPQVISNNKEYFDDDVVEAALAETEGGVIKDENDSTNGNPSAYSETVDTKVNEEINNKDETIEKSNTSSNE